jgi:hypothetical protein
MRAINLHEILQRYDNGVRFGCGCEERGLHPALRRALLEGRVRADGLLRCPVHHAPLTEDATLVVVAGGTTAG